MQENDLVILLVLAAVAGFLLFRLRNVLGERSGFEDPSKYTRAQGVAESESGGDEANNVVPMPRREEQPDDSDIFAFTEVDSELGKSLKTMKEAEPGLDIRTFMDGAKAAYEMLLVAFENGDKDMLRQFLADDVYDAFCASIDQRRAQNLHVDMRFVGIRTAEPIEAEFDPETGKAEITVKYVAEIVMAIRNAQSEVVEGDPSAVRRTNDIWTYGRTLGGGDPNWTLVATGG